MNTLIQPGRIIFAIGMTALGVLCIVSNDFIIGRPPVWPEGVSLNPALAFITGLIVMVACIAILIHRQEVAAAISIAALIVLLSLTRHLFHFMNDWLNTYKTLALCGGALIVASTADRRYTGLRLSDDIRKKLQLTGSVLLSIFFIACGYAHFKFAEFVKTFIPDYIPFRSFWTYFTAVCLLAGGAGLLIPFTRRWAAFLSGIMVGGWVILLHVPRLLAAPNDPSDRMGLCEAFALTGVFFVLAGVFSRNNN